MDKKILLSCAAIAGLLCFSQIRGSRILILLCLVLFVALVSFACLQRYELPVLLFFLPWTSLLRTSPDSISAYTLALLIVGMIRIVQSQYRLKNFYVGIALLILATTLLSKIISGYRLTNSYIMFIAMLVLYPLTNFGERNYDFFHLTVFFSFGIVIAALTAQQFSTYPNIAKYIQVDSYLSITRRSGYYGDPNFYAAHITAALAGCLMLLEEARSKSSLFVLSALLGLLAYCGVLSGSKSFLLIFALLVLLWIAEILLAHNKISRKISFILGMSGFIVYIGTSAIFQEKIGVIMTRLSWAKDASGFTTGRTDLWRIYLSRIFSDLKLFLLGQGFTNVIIGQHASHNSLIQLVYQLGILGSGLLISWFVALCKDIVGICQARDLRSLPIMILLAGALLPWLAIDILFFDEFFLITTYAFIGITEMGIVHEMN